MNNLNLLLFFVLCFGSCDTQRANNIVPLKMLTEVDTLKHDSNTSAYRSDYFMIEDYRASNLRMDINDYVIKNLDSNYLKFDQYTMYFYKESKVVNIDYINRFHKNSRYKAIEDEKPVLHYVWYNGKLHIYDF